MKYKELKYYILFTTRQYYGCPYPLCKACTLGGYTINDGATLIQSKLDEIASCSHPLALDQTKAFLCHEPYAACTPLPLNEKKFCGNDMVLATYHQLAHQTYPMRNMTGLGPQLQGQCFKPVITFLTATIKVTSSEFCDTATYVSITMLNQHINTHKYLLHKESDTYAFDLFRSGAMGMHMVSCMTDGHPHYIRYDGWRGVIYEPMNNDLASLDAEDVERSKAGIR